MRKLNSSHNIALYVRVSSEDQAANPEGSLKSQEQRLRQHVATRNQDGDLGKIVRIFVDRAKSGKDTNRPELQKLLKAIRDREVNMVLVTELSRLSRSLKDFCSIWDLMRDHDCAFQSLREQFDTTTAAGEMVLFNMANFAQFERRQISERVCANLLARAQRGLYNGGCIPFGYKLDPEKKGYLLVDQEAAKIVKTVFEIFLKEGSLNAAGKSLNKKGYRLTLRMQGGSRTRLGYFTVGNLHRMLTNKMYLGLKIYKVNGQEKFAKATWPAIISDATFARANEILKKNHRKLKTGKRRKYPYLLSGLVFCGKCQDNMSGKSANGNGGMIPYYEHSWLTKKQCYLNKKIFECKPNRVLAKLIEPKVWAEVVNMISQPKLAKSVIDEASLYHREHSHLPEKEKLQSKIVGVDKQLEALAEHLAKIPKNVSPTHIFRQMEKLEDLKRENENTLSAFEENGESQEMPVALKTYQAFLEAIEASLLIQDDSTFKQKIVEKLIHKVELLPNGLKIHWYSGEDHFIQFDPNGGKHEAAKSQKEKGANPSGLAPSIFFGIRGSNTFTIGSGGKCHPKPLKLLTSKN
jgi:site-specific DNA recombinase